MAVVAVVTAVGLAGATREAAMAVAASAADAWAAARRVAMVAEATAAEVMVTAAQEGGGVAAQKEAATEATVVPKVEAGSWLRRQQSCTRYRARQSP